VRRSRRDKRKRKSGIPGCREDICVMKYPRDTRTHRPRLFSSGPRIETEEKWRIPVFPLPPPFVFCFIPRGIILGRRTEIRRNPGCRLSAARTFRAGVCGRPPSDFAFTTTWFSAGGVPPVIIDANDNRIRLSRGRELHGCPTHLLFATVSAGANCT